MKSLRRWKNTLFVSWIQDSRILQINRNISLSQWNSYLHKLKCWLWAVPTVKSEHLYNIMANIYRRLGYNYKNVTLIIYKEWTVAKGNPQQRVASNSNIIVRLLRRDCMDSLLAAARRNRTLTSPDIGLLGVERRIFQNDHAF